MEYYKTLEQMILATSGYVEGKYTAEECNSKMTTALSEYAEQLNILHVNHRRELLKGFFDLFNETDDTPAIINERIEEYIKTL